MKKFLISKTRRLRSTPFTSRLEKYGVGGYTVYNHMLLPTFFESVESEYEHLKNHVQDAMNIPMPDLRKRSAELERDTFTVVYCNKGVTSNTAQNLLINIGFKEVAVLSGGNTNYQHYQKSKKA